MTKGKLYISVPKEESYKVYNLSSTGRVPSLDFHWASFDSSHYFQWCLEETKTEDLIANLASFKQHPEGKGKEDYLRLLQKAINETKVKALEKIVISRCKKENILINNPVEFFKKLIKKYPSACVYLFYHPEIGCWIGATPETLLKSRDNKIESMSLAGTRTVNKAHTFTHKEKLEQQLVTDYIKNVFELTKELRKVKIEGLSFKKAGDLVHLHSIISAKKEIGFQLSSLLKNLHPTPAVAGNPIQEAIKFIKAHEAYPRSYYTGYFGIEIEENCDFFVNLRCVQLFKDGLVLYAGGGITTNSNPLSEWEETEAKMRTLRSILAF